MFDTGVMLEVTYALGIHAAMMVANGLSSCTSHVLDLSLPEACCVLPLLLASTFLI